MPTLWVVAGPNVGARFDFEREVTMGRSSTCEVVLRDRRISRRHAQVHAAGAGFEVADLGSRNGFLKNGHRVQGTEPLLPGDRLQVGASHFVFDPPPLFELIDSEPAPPLRAGEGAAAAGESAAMAKLERAALAWAAAPTPAAILRLGLQAAAEALGADRAGILLLPPGGDRVDVVARRGPGTPRLPRDILGELRQGRRAGTDGLLAAPIEAEALSLFVERTGGGYRALDLELCAAIATLCGRSWEGARGHLKGGRDPALGFWRQKSASFGPVLRKLVDRIVDAAPHQGPILLRGERSTGRQAFAYLLHLRGRDGNPFQTPRAVQVKETGWPLWLSRTEGGTLYLGDVAELHDPEGLVAALSQQETGLPSDPRLPAAVRLVASSQVDLDELVEDQRLPLDLAERFLGATIEVPRLRDLRLDLPSIIERTLPEVCRHVGRPVPQLAAETVELMQAYPWPGNYAELTACLAGLALAAGEGPVEPWALPVSVRLGKPTGPAPGGSLAEAVEAVERAAIVSALRAAGWRKLHAARALHISRPTLDKKIAQYGLRLGGPT
ncbi:MAG: FHA domain-containing protein [Myxococcales bacterium]